MVARLKPLRVKIANVTFDLDSSFGPSSQRRTLLRLQDLYAPWLSELLFLRSIGPAIQVCGCFQTKIERTHFRDLPNTADAPSVKQYGYGIEDMSSDQTMVTDCSGHECRHVYTTSTEPTTGAPTVSTLWQYGRTENALVTNCTGMGCSNSAFDTHEEARAIKFVNCRAIGNYRGDASAGAGFSARGFDIGYDGCTTLRCRIGFDIGTVDGCYLDGCEALECDIYGVYINSSESNNSSAYFMRNIRLRGSIFECSPINATSVLRVQRTADFESGYEWSAEDCTFRLRGNASANRRVLLVSDARNSFRLRNCVVDLKELTGTVVRNILDTLVDADTTIESVDIDGLAIQWGDRTDTVQIALFEGKAGQTFRASRVRWEGTVAGAKPPLTKIAKTIDGLWLRDYEAIVYEIGGTDSVERLSTRSVSLSAAWAAGKLIGPAADFPGLADDIIHIDAAITADFTTSNAIGTGHHRGQRVLIRNSGTATATMSAFGMVLSPGAYIELVWSEVAGVLDWRVVRVFGNEQTFASLPATIAMKQDGYVRLTGTAGGTVSLPNTGLPKGLTLTIKDVGGNASLNPITIDGSSLGIDSLLTTTFILSVNHEAVTLRFNGTFWEVL
jgi:hypothetical protein